MVRALQLVCALETPAVSDVEKLSFFNETRHAFGRSAMMFSGGSTMGARVLSVGSGGVLTTRSFDGPGLYHAGVIKALDEAALLPRIISGASVGAVIAAILGTTAATRSFCRLPLLT